MAIKGIIFDLDGVIVNGQKFSEHFENDYNHPIQRTVEFIRGEEFQNCLTGKGDLRTILPGFIEHTSFKGSVDELMGYWFNKEHKIDPHMLDIIKNLRQKGVKCFLATNQEQNRTNYIRKQMNLESEFDSIFASSELEQKKPDNAFFETMANKIKENHGLEKEELIFFDDSEKNILGANDFGIKSFLFKDRDTFQTIINKYLQE